MSEERRNTLGGCSHPTHYLPFIQ